MVQHGRLVPLNESCMKHGAGRTCVNIWPRIPSFRLLRPMMQTIFRGIAGFCHVLQYFILKTSSWTWMLDDFPWRNVFCQLPSNKSSASKAGGVRVQIISAVFKQSWSNRPMMTYVTLSNSQLSTLNSSFSLRRHCSASGCAAKESIKGNPFNVSSVTIYSLLYSLL